MQSHDATSGVAGCAGASGTRKRECDGPFFAWVPKIVTAPAVAATYQVGQYSTQMHDCLEHCSWLRRVQLPA